LKVVCFLLKTNKVGLYAISLNTTSFLVSVRECRLYP